MQHNPNYQTMLKPRPTTLKEANAFVGEEHRHHPPVAGHRWSMGCKAESKLVGVVIVGRAVARQTDQYEVAEVTRLATNGHRNACSFLYARATHIARLMGFRSIQTFTLASESGSSIKALKELGWKCLGPTKDGGWKTRSGRRDQLEEKTIKWECLLNDT